MENGLSDTLHRLKRGLYQKVHETFLGGRVPLHWWRGEQNWGDALNPVLAKLLSEHEVKFTKIKYCDGYLAIGSVLGLANSHTTVWGSGFMAQGQILREHPQSIRAVRGPLTRAMLLEQGIECPKIFGDPALLLPLFYNQTVPRKYRLGIIPHYRDANDPWVKDVASKPDVLVIDVKSDIFGFVDSIRSCENIVSSSLHGLICADAYNVPNIHIELSDKVAGNNFKFNDYAASVGRASNERVNRHIGNTPEAVIKAIQDFDVDIDLKSLLLSCPFLSENLRKKFNGIESGQLSLASIRKSRRPISL